MDFLSLSLPLFSLPGEIVNEPNGFALLRCRRIIGPPSLSVSKNSLSLGVTSSAFSVVSPRPAFMVPPPLPISFHLRPIRLRSRVILSPKGIMSPRARVSSDSPSPSLFFVNAAPGPGNSESRSRLSLLPLKKLPTDRRSSDIYRSLCAPVGSSSFPLFMQRILQPATPPYPNCNCPAFQGIRFFHSCPLQDESDLDFPA